MKRLASRRQRSRLGGALLLPLLVAAALASMSWRAGADGAFVVVVNVANSHARLSSDAVSDLFLKKAAVWPSGIRVFPVDLAGTSPVRDSFSRTVHEKSTMAIKAYWQKMIFEGRDVPPPEKGTPEEVLEYVRSRSGGIGYVPAGTPLGSGVKILSIER